MAKKILIIEDEKALAEEWERGLKYEGYDAQIATNLPEVLNILDRLDFDLVLLDVMLPSLDVSEVINLNSIRHGRTAGVWVARMIKERKPSLPIVAITVVTDPAITGDLRDAGVERVLNKPVSVQDVVKTITLLCE